ncbi:hypothetical protein [Noviherbaspirillum galbum]|uniref:Uncharacterized protein n=1 Tax=Noviherbaspirillum galbum TaxID=2709383 RepID=A0A6B3SHD3_9BURK|nr:hypothetical protein [Noviherbaspirillum galbum]NEX60060.1 hypothetical protein [Noviherbaspirillum galbum]
MELFLKELDTAPLALLLWLSGALMVMAPKFISDAAVSLWSLLAIAMTGFLAFQVTGYEHFLPLEAKIGIVVGTLVFLGMVMVTIWKMIQQEKLQWIEEERAKVHAWRMQDMARSAVVYDHLQSASVSSRRRSW